MRLRVRARVATALGALGLPEAVLALRRRGRPGWLTVLNYHRVNVPEAAVDVDPEVIDATPEVLAQHLTFLKRYFTPIALADVLAFLEGHELPPNPVLVTFDDGYRDNLDIAVPILLRHGFRATFFVATAYVAERRLFWWDRVEWTLKHSRHKRFSLEYPGKRHVDLTAPRASDPLLALVKSHHGLDLDRFLAELSEAAGADWTPAVEAELVERLILTWDDVRALRTAGMDVGSHTRTHRVLQTLNTDALLGEVAGSKADLEGQLGERVVAIAYPVGDSVIAEPAILRALEDAGYKLGFSYRTGVQSLRVLHRFNIRRVAADESYNDSHFRILLALPWRRRDQ